MRSIIEINLSNLENNYTNIYNSIKKDIIAIVKDNAYGHGILQITNALIKCGVKIFAVATTSEAILLRRNFPSITIILFEQETDFNLLFQYKITLSISSMDYLKKAIASNYSFPIHLKIETGLNRLGIYQSQSEECFTLLKKSRLILRGIYTHIASLNTYSSQLYVFKKELLRYKDYKNLIIHINSSHYIKKDGISTHYRIGLALYGLINIPELNLKPLLTLKAPVYRVKKVNKNDLISYNNAKINQDGYILTIPLGYGDGWIMSRCTIGYYNSYLKQVGDTCMDMLMLFSPTFIKEKEMIEFISNNLPLQDLSKFYNESIYQIVTLLSSRITRKYIT